MELDMHKNIFSENYSGNKYVYINNLKLHYLDFGGTDDYLLFLSGLGDTAYSFSSLAPRFTANFHALALTRRGFGKSDAPQDAYDLQLLIDDIVSFLDILGISQVSLIGHSLAGNEMTLLASRFPEKVKKIVYLDAAFSRGQELRTISQNDPTNLYSSKMPANAFDSLGNYFHYYKLKHPNLSKIWCPILEKLCLERLHIHANGSINEIDYKKAKNQIKKSLENFDFSYTSIQSPILSIYALQDEHPHITPDLPVELRWLANEYNRDFWIPYTQKNIMKLLDENKNATIVELWGADHYCHLSNEDEVYNHISKFLKSGI